MAGELIGIPAIFVAYQVFHGYFIAVTNKYGYLCAHIYPHCITRLKQTNNRVSNQQVAHRG